MAKLVEAAAAAGRLTHRLARVDLALQTRVDVGDGRTNVLSRRGGGDGFFEIHHVSIVHCRTMSDDLQAALAHHKAGRFAEAEAMYRASLSQRPDDPKLLHLLGTLLLQRRQFAEAAAMLQQAATLAPHVAEIAYTLGDALRFAGRPVDAEAAYRKAISIRVLFPPAHNGLGLALVAQGKLESAAAAWRRAIQLKGDYAEAHANLGAALAQQQKPSEAAEVLRKAIHLNPKFAPAHNNLANVLDELEETDEAIKHWTIAVELQPNYFDALVNLSKAAEQRGEFQKSLDLIERAVALRPNDPDARFLRGIGLLRRGDLLQGFADYQFRFQCPELKLAHRTFPQPPWTGNEDVAGRTILIHAEQGLGDAIQCIRYAPLLAERGVTVIVECPHELLALIQSVKGVQQFIPHGSPLPPFDLHATVLSLPMAFRTTLDTIPANVPYLAPSADRVEAWRQILAEDPSTNRRVGLVWSGNPKHANDANRSIPLREFEPLADMAELTFFSLQKGPAAGQMGDSTLKLKLIDHTARLKDFNETAALIAQLDLVITVDTSVAHVAGAMGKPVWVLLPYVPDWRWLLDRNDSPWYPTMRLIRQPKIGDWPSVVRRVVEGVRNGFVL